MLPLRGVGPVVPVPESAVDQFAGLSCARPQSGFCGESVCSADAAEQLSWSVATFRGELGADAFPPASAFRRRMFALLGRDADFHLHGGRLGHISAWLDVLASDGSPQGSDGPALTCGDPRGCHQRLSATRLHLRDRTPAVAGRKASAALSRSHARSGARHTACTMHRRGGKPTLKVIICMHALSCLVLSR